MAAKAQLENILKSVAENEQLEAYEVIPDKDILKGDGFLSEFHTGSIKNTATGELLDVYVKFQPNYNPNVSIQDVYTNEVQFYSRIWPLMDKFQKERKVKVALDKVAKFFVGNADDEPRYIVLENLKAHGYVLQDKSKFLDKQKLKVLFETYGKFHAITYSLKDQLQEEYRKIMLPVKDVFGQFMNTVHFEIIIKNIIKTAYECIKETNEESAKKVERFLKNFTEYSNKSRTYEGKYAALTHGDCWSNNILFKYDPQGNLTNLKLIDFQLMREGTPIHDLSYFFYSGAAKADLDKLDEYLDIYHKSFSSFASELGSDPEQMLPLKDLKEEWKRYSIFGIIMSLMIWQVKFVEKSNIENLSEEQMKDVNKWEEMVQKVFAMPQFKKNISDLLLHAVEYGIL